MFISVLSILLMTVVVGVVVSLASDARVLEPRPRLAGVAVTLFVFLAYSALDPLFTLFVLDALYQFLLVWECLALSIGVVTGYAFTSGLLTRQRCALRRWRVQRRWSQ